MCMAELKIEIHGYLCERCGHNWLPRVSLDKLRNGNIDEKPIICPKCKSPYWDRPKRNKTNHISIKSKYSNIKQIIKRK